MDDSNSSPDQGNQQAGTITIKPFINQGHYTSVHDAVFDVLMPRLSGNEFKVLMFVLRKTRGWKKDTDRISYSQIQQGAGIGSRETVRTVVNRLVKADLLVQVDSYERESATPYEYALNLGYAMTVKVTTPAVKTTRPVPKNGRGGVPKNGRGGVPKNGTDNNHPSQEPPSKKPKGLPSSADEWIAHLTERCEEVEFTPTPKQKATWSNELVSKKRKAQDPQELMALANKIVVAAGEGWFWSFKRAEEGPPGKRSNGNGHNTAQNNTDTLSKLEQAARRREGYEWLFKE